MTDDIHSDDAMLDSTIITEGEGSFLQQVGNLWPDIRRQFLSTAKLYLRGIKKHFADFEKFNAITEAVHGLTTFVSLIMLEHYEYAHVLRDEAQEVVLPTAIGTLDELFERAKEAFSDSITSTPTHIPGNVVAVRCVFRFRDDKRICFLIIGLTDHDSLQAIEHTDKNVLFGERDLAAAEALLHGKIAERVRNDIGLDIREKEAKL